MQGGFLFVMIGVGIGLTLLAILGVMRFKEMKDVQSKNNERTERDAKMIERWAAKESKRAER